ncbi:BA75_03777T0 [Komagataella pastoris]|uniref:BA75_03777T0 n=1 Tax=Komagataella pastoris TaxID=4922 RepID=A0A1B2JFI1_PICPA|nr:BA75_03777T0 [Komagataella pastoris]
MKGGRDVQWMLDGGGGEWRAREDEGKKQETKIELTSEHTLSLHVEFLKSERSHRKGKQQSRENLPVQVPSFVRLSMRARGLPRLLQFFSVKIPFSSNIKCSYNK